MKDKDLSRLLYLLKKRYGETSVYTTDHEGHKGMYVWVKDCSLSKDPYQILDIDFITRSMKLDSEIKKRDKNLYDAVYRFCRTRNLDFNSTIPIDNYYSEWKSAEIQNELDKLEFHEGMEEFLRTHVLD